MTLTVRALTPDDVATCKRVLRSLPQWFAIEESNREYIASLSRLPAFVAAQDDDVYGFVAIEQHNPGAAEIYVIAVAQEAHRRGVGRALVAEAERWCRDLGIVWLHVKTRGPSDPDEHYAKTQAFYEAVGFAPLFETTAFWGLADPTLVLVKQL